MGMALDSTSTLGDALAEYRANADWEGDETKAAAALKAVRFVLTEISISSSGKTTSETRSEMFWLGEKKRLEAFVKVAKGDSTRTTFVEPRFLYL